MWFRPALIGLAFLAAAIVLVQVEHSLHTDIPLLGYGGSPEMASELLSVIGGAVIGLAGLVLSFTLLTMQLVASQYSPRALREFLSSRPTQWLTGAFAGIVVYILWVLQAIRVSVDRGEYFVPQIAVTIALLMGLGSIGLLLAYVHHVSQMVQVSTIVARIFVTTLHSIEHLYPEKCGRPGEQGDWAPDGVSQAVTAGATGHVQQVSFSTLTENGLSDLHVQIPVRPGDFVGFDTVIATFWGGDEETVTERVRAAVVIDWSRDAVQDPAFGLEQLADIAMRALSPSLNDPTTAMSAARYQGVLIEQLARRASPSSIRSFDEDLIVVHAAQRPFAEYLNVAFLGISHYARRDARVVAVVLDALQGAARAAKAAGHDQHVGDIAAVARDLMDGARDATDSRLEMELIDRQRAAFEHETQS